MKLLTTQDLWKSQNLYLPEGLSCAENKRNLDLRLILLNYITNELY